jgi:adenylate cyclase
MSLAVAAGLLALRAAGALEPLELGAHDLLLRWTGPPGGLDPRVVIVAVSERDIQKYGHPLSDEILARALAALAEGGARAVGVDLYRDRPVPPGDAELAGLVAAHPEIVLAERVGDSDQEPVAPPAYLAGTHQVGFSDVPLDGDGRVRRALLLGRSEGRSAVSLALQVALRALAAEGVVPRWIRPPGEREPVATLALGEVPLPRFQAGEGGYVGADAGGYQILLAHPRGRARFASIGLDELLSGGGAREAVRGRAVLFGTMASSVHDLLPTPFGELYGVEHHARVVGELLDRALEGARGMRALSDAQEGALVLFASVAGALLAAWLRSPWTLPAAALAALALLALGSAASFAAGWWLPVVPAGLGFALSGGVAEACVSFGEQRDRRRAMDLFGRFLSRDVAGEVWRDRDDFLHGGRPHPRSAVLTVMMTDVAGYSSASESLGPERLMAWIDSYLEAIARAVGAHGGVVDDFAGDGLKANFGLAVTRQSEAERDADAAAAVACALDLEAKIERLNQSWASRGYPPARVRVGLHTGPAVVGVVGSAEERLKFTSVGDAVNTAARLESWQSDEFRAESDTLRILASEETFRRLRGGYLVEQLGRVELKGKAEPVVVYRIRGRVRPGGNA